MKETRGDVWVVSNGGQQQWFFYERVSCGEKRGPICDRGRSGDVQDTPVDSRRCRKSE